MNILNLLVRKSCATCPICGGKKFLDFNGRIKAQCHECKSLERSRLMWMILKKLDVIRPGIRVLHVAPELCLLERFSKIASENYYPCDLEPKNYNNRHCKVNRINLCTDLSSMPTATYDLIVHNHVLEHLPCDIVPVIKDLNRTLAPGGLHLFSVPFRGRFTVEDLNPNLSAEERTSRFAQSDHMRLFGTEDFPNFLDKNFPETIKLFDLEAKFSKKDMLNANIPEDVLSNISGHSFFYYQRRI